MALRSEQTAANERSGAGGGGGALAAAAIGAVAEGGGARAVAVAGARAGGLTIALVLFGMTEANAAHHVASLIARAYLGRELNNKPVDSAATQVLPVWNGGVSARPRRSGRAAVGGEACA